MLDANESAGITISRILSVSAGSGRGTLRDTRATDCQFTVVLRLSSSYCSLFKRQIFPN